jgi:NAD-dependent dihydropyrimidine dehydrogenase PreA subunit
VSLLSWVCLTPRRPAATTTTQPPDRRSEKWLPVIDRDSCLGCERCVSVCEQGSLEMIWSFATLTQPQSCTGEGRCAQACPQQIIRMEWVAVETTDTPDAGPMAIGRTAPCGSR